MSRKSFRHYAREPVKGKGELLCARSMENDVTTTLRGDEGSAWANKIQRKLSLINAARDFTLSCLVLLQLSRTALY